MSARELLEGMSYVDERFVDEAERDTISKKVLNPWIRLLPIAACLCIIVFSLYNIQPYLSGETESAAGQGAADGMAEGTLENEKEDASGDAGAAKAPETMIRIIEVTETGFVGTVQNNGGFTAFEDGTEITVTVDLDTDPNFKPEDYQVGDLVHIMYTDWDVNERIMVASILGIVDEPTTD